MSLAYAKNEQNSIKIIEILKSLIIAIIVSLAGILLFALAIKFFCLDDKWISPINYAIKALSIVCGVFVLTKGKEGGLKKGVVFGILYIVIAFLVFSILLGKFNITLSLVLDTILGGLVGGIFGILFVNIKSKNF